MATYTTAENSTTPCTIGKSLAMMASTAKRPNPGRAKTVSTMTAPHEAGDDRRFPDPEHDRRQHEVLP